MPTSRLHEESAPQKPDENQDFVEEKFKELDSDQIEGGEFEFLGLEDRFERNKQRKFLNVEFEILEPKSKFRLDHA